MSSPKEKIVILDLGINNINSVRRAFQDNNQESEITIRDNGLDPDTCSLVVLPGLGSFESGMEQLKHRGLDEYLLRAAESEVSILGICLGMQLLGDTSEESPGVHGLGLIPGHNLLLPIIPGERIPNIGWMGGKPDNEGNLFPSLSKGKDFYFVHSYHFSPKSGQDCIFKSVYGGIEITAGIKRGKVLGFQFHPEKSSNIGFELVNDISNWALNEN
jgi:glutamine amidotransferase